MNKHCKKNLNEEIDLFINKYPKFKCNKNLVNICINLHKNKFITFQDELLSEIGYSGRFKLFRFGQDLERRKIPEPDIYGPVSKNTFKKYMITLNNEESNLCLDIYDKIKENL